MKIKILLYGLSIMIMSNILFLTAVDLYNIRSFIVMLFLSMIVFITWKLLLQAEVPISIKTTDNKIILKTSLLLIIPLLAIIYFIFISYNINYSLLSLMFLTSLATGIYEELLFRGITLGSLIHANVKPKKAIFISAIIFSLFHLLDIGAYTNIQVALKLFNTFIMGVVFAYIYYSTNNIFYVIAIHTIWDLESFLDSQYISDTFSSIFPIILFALSFLYCTWSCKQIKKLNL